MDMRVMLGAEVGAPKVERDSKESSGAFNDSEKFEQMVREEAGPGADMETLGRTILLETLSIARESLAQGESMQEDLTPGKKPFGSFLQLLKNVLSGEATDLNLSEQSTKEAELLEKAQALLDLLDDPGLESDEFMSRLEVFTSALCDFSGINQEEGVDLIRSEFSELDVDLEKRAMKPVLVWKNPRRNSMSRATSVGGVPSHGKESPLTLIKGNRVPREIGDLVEMSLEKQEPELANIPGLTTTEAAELNQMLSQLEAMVASNEVLSAIEEEPGFDVLKKAIVLQVGHSLGKLSSSRHVKVMLRPVGLGAIDIRLTAEGKGLKLLIQPERTLSELAISANAQELQSIIGKNVKIEVRKKEKRQGIGEAVLDKEGDFLNALNQVGDSYPISGINHMLGGQEVDPDER